MKQMMQLFDRLRPAAPLALRVVLGGSFVYHGYDKFDGGISMVETMFDSWGVPVAGLAAPLTAIVEIVAGTALIVGLGTRIAATALGVVMIGALLYVKTDLGVISTEPMPGAELDLALLAGLVTIIAIGAGRLSVDAAVGLDPTTGETDERPELVPA
jgi:putative oxidoreductase